MNVVIRVNWRMMIVGIMLNKVDNGMCRTVLRRSKVIPHKVFKMFSFLNYSIGDSGNNG